MFGGHATSCVHHAVAGLTLRWEEVCFSFGLTTFASLQRRQSDNRELPALDRRNHASSFGLTVFRASWHRQDSGSSLLKEDAGRTQSTVSGPQTGERIAFLASSFEITATASRRASNCITTSMFPHDVICRLFKVVPLLPKLQRSAREPDPLHRCLFTRDLAQQVSSLSPFLTSRIGGYWRMESVSPQGPVLFVHPRAGGHLPHVEMSFTVFCFRTSQCPWHSNVTLTSIFVRASGCCRPESPVGRRSASVGNSARQMHTCLPY